MFVFVYLRSLLYSNLRLAMFILQIARKFQGIIDLQRRGREGDLHQNERVRTWAGSDVFF